MSLYIKSPDERIYNCCLTYKQQSKLINDIKTILLNPIINWYPYHTIHDHEFAFEDSSRFMYFGGDPHPIYIIEKEKGNIYIKHLIINNKIFHINRYSYKEYCNKTDIKYPKLNKK